MSLENTKIDSDLAGYGDWTNSAQYRRNHCTVTFTAQIQFRSHISSAVPDSRKCEVSKS